MRDPAHRLAVTLPSPALLVLAVTLPSPALLVLACTSDLGAREFHAKQGRDGS